MADQEELQLMADEMGISLYSRFSLDEAAQFLGITSVQLQTLCSQKQITHLSPKPNSPSFFGMHLLEYLLSTVVKSTSAQLDPNHSDRIIRINEVIERTGLSRTTLWRREINGEFPKRVSLGGSAVGWKDSEVNEWLNTRH